MKNDRLFAIDTKTDEIIISESPKGTMTVNLIERIRRQDNEILYNSVITLTSITKQPNFNIIIFKAMDKVCNLIYATYKDSELKTTK
jgi:hypothetical protein